MSTYKKLIPPSRILRESLELYKDKFNLNNSYRAGQSNDPLLSVFDFIAGIHGKEMHISNPAPRGSGSQSVGNWAFKTILNRNVVSNYFINRFSRQFQIGTVIASTKDEWLEFQGSIFGTYILLDPVSLIIEDMVPDVEFWKESCGLFPVNGLLTGADGEVFAISPTNDPIQFAIDWNTVKVPYDKSAGYNTQYVFGVTTNAILPTGQKWLRFIGNIDVNINEAVNYWNSVSML